MVLEGEIKGRQVAVCLLLTETYPTEMHQEGDAHDGVTAQDSSQVEEESAVAGKVMIRRGWLINRDILAWT